MIATWGDKTAKGEYRQTTVRRDQMQEFISWVERYATVCLNESGGCTHQDIAE